MEEREFKKHAEEALTALQRDLILAADDYGFESSLRGGSITITLHHPPGKFTVVPDSTTRQMKISLPARSYKLDWDVVENAFIHTETRETLKELLEEAISKHLKQEVEL